MHESEVAWTDRTPTRFLKKKLNSQVRKKNLPNDNITSQANMNKPLFFFEYE